MGAFTVGATEGATNAVEEFVKNRYQRQLLAQQGQQNFLAMAVMRGLLKPQLDANGRPTGAFTTTPGIKDLPGILQGISTNMPGYQGIPKINALGETEISIVPNQQPGGMPTTPGLTRTGVTTGPGGVTAKEEMLPVQQMMAQWNILKGAFGGSGDVTGPDMGANVTHMALNPMGQSLANPVSQVTGPSFQSTGTPSPADTSQQMGGNVPPQGQPSAQISQGQQWHGTTPSGRRYRYLSQ